MKIIINTPHNLDFGEIREPFDEVELTLPEEATLQEMVTAFKTALYAQTYHPSTIDGVFEKYEDQ